MASKSILILCLTLAVCFCLSEAAPKKPTTNWKCTPEDKLEVDNIVARIMTYGRKDRRFPKDTKELKHYCKDQNHLVASLEDYKNQCLKERPKQIVSIVVYSIRALITSYCKNPNAKKTKDLISSAHCANSASTDYLKCNDRYVDLLMAVENSKDSKKQLGQMCCGYVEVFKCVQEQAALHKSCTEEKVEANVNYIRGFFDNAVNVICGDYNDQSDKCDKFALVRKSSKDKSARPNSYFSPLVKVLSNL